MKLCFDCDDTLYDLQWPFKKCLKKFFPSFDGDSQEFYRIYRDFGDSVFDLLQDDVITVDDSGIYRIYKASAAMGYPIDLETAADFQDLYKKNQGAISMSEAYHRFFQTTKSELAILTNGSDCHQRMKLHALEVEKYFPSDHIFTSGQIGFAKPHPKAFQIVAEATKTKVSDWTYIGDNYINDMEGAKNAGMHTIHLNRHHHQEGNCSDYTVYTEEELIDLLARLENA